MYAEVVKCWGRVMKSEGLPSKYLHNLVRVLRNKKGWGYRVHHRKPRLTQKVAYMYLIAVYVIACHVTELCIYLLRFSFFENEKWLQSNTMLTRDSFSQVRSLVRIFNNRIEANSFFFACLGANPIKKFLFKKDHATFLTNASNLTVILLIKAINR